MLASICVCLCPMRWVTSDHKSEGRAKKGRRECDIGWIDELTERKKDPMYILGIIDWFTNWWFALWNCGCFTYFMLSYSRRKATKKRFTYGRYGGRKYCKHCNSWVIRATTLASYPNKNLLIILHQRTQVTSISKAQILPYRVIYRRCRRQGRNLFRKAFVTWDLFALLL